MLNLDFKGLDRLFRKEKEILEQAKRVLSSETENLTISELIEHYDSLTNSYERLLKHQVKLTRTADNNQSKLRKSQIQLDETNQKINAQNEELTKLNQTKDKFFSIVSHDLRNPLTAIMLMGEILKSNMDNMTKDSLSKQIVKIADSTKLLNELFENLHRWSKAQSGILDFTPEEFNLLLIVKNVNDLLKVHADNKNIELRHKVEPDVTIYGDKNMIETIIRNLVNNAIKFTNKGGYVEVSYEKLNNGFDKISVKDDGIGINDFIKSKLFKLGESSVKKKGTAQEPGSGLGLVLCKEFIDKHKGKIWVESEEGKGSQFFFTVPPQLF